MKLHKKTATISNENNSDTINPNPRQREKKQALWIIFLKYQAS